MQTQRVIDLIVSWLAEYGETSRSEGFVVGVSGGVDSAVTAALTARTGAPTLLLEMPIYQAESQVQRAQDQIQSLEKRHANVRDLRVDLSAAFERFQQTVTRNPQGEAEQLALANARARLRMTTLYFYAQIHHYLVVGTGNKVEDFGVGFFTKYGDGGVDLSPIADLYKSEVYTLAEALEIDQAILKAPPTDGLWGDDRSDKDQLGASYEELEWAMKSHPISEPEALSDRARAVYQRYEALHEKNAHKFHPIPVARIPEALKRDSG